MDMFSRLEPILRTVVRKTEAADTRLAIRRDESKDLGDRKSGHGHDEYSPMEWEDIALVSTASLRTFLQSLIEAPAAPAAPAAAPHHAPTTMGARATNAYQTMGRAVHDRNVTEESAPPAHADTATVLGHDFVEQELALVRRYIGDLIELERRGVESLSIQRSASFLDGVREGIRLAEESLKAPPA